MNKFTFLALLAVSLVSGGTLVAQEMKAKPPVTMSEAQSTVIVTPETFQDYAAANVGKEVEIKGMVIHVCKHGGKKLFVIGEDPEMRVKINASDKVGVFAPELEGSTISVMGIIEPIEEEVVPEAEKATEDSDHKNYYHTPQYAISCMELRTIEE